MSKKVLIILGHPRKQSFCGALANAYKDGALKSGADVKEIILSDLKFNPIFIDDKLNGQEFESDLKNAQDLIKWSEHIVFVYPNWWGTMPALLKGFFDRVFVPGFAYKFTKGKYADKLLGGKSASIIVTMDTPPWLYYLYYGAAGYKVMRNGILNFCGIAPVKIFSIGPVIHATNKKREFWLKKINKIGEKLK